MIPRMAVISHFSASRGEKCKNHTTVMEMFNYFCSENKEDCISLQFHRVESKNYKLEM